MLRCDSDRQLADGLTKSAKQDVIKNFLVTGIWKLRVDGAFISAKKRIGQATQLLSFCKAPELCCSSNFATSIHPSLGCVKEGTMS